MTLSAAALELLVQYRWPGNFRQLVSTLRAILALTEPSRVITPELLRRELRSREVLQEVEGPQDAEVNPGAADSRQVAAFAAALPAEDLRSSRRAAVERVLAACDGNVSRAARRLGIHRSTIYRLLSATETSGRET